jgi:hypothetical protein
VRSVGGARPGMDCRRGARRHRGGAGEKARLAPGQPALSVSQCHHHTARRILLGGVDWRRAPARCRGGRTCLERPSRPLARQHDRRLVRRSDLVGGREQN